MKTQSQSVFRKYLVLFIICGVLLALLLGMGGYLLITALLDPYDCRILNNVSIAGVQVGGMTRKEATEAVEAATLDTYTQNDMVIVLPEQTLRLSPADTGASLNIKQVIKAAYAYGREGTEEENLAAYEASQNTEYALSLEPYLGVDESYIRSALEDYAKAYNIAYTDAAFQLEGEKPQLQADLFDPEAEAQTLVVTIGTPRVELDIDAVMEQVRAAYNENRFEVTVEEIAPLATPEGPDLAAMHEQLTTAAVDCSLNMETYQYVPGTYGYTFDLEAAQTMADNAVYGETIRIPMETVRAEILGDEVYFRDILGYCETKHNTNENRNNNLRLLCEALDGMILQPGEEFSYNEALGERTAERGYLPAPAYSGDRLVDSIGGGVCQGSTTLYNCVLLADLEVVERLCHGARVSYVPLGLDATVNWGTTDFKFRNSANFPIMIRAEVSEGYVKMWLMGTDEKDYYIVMTSGYDDSNPGYIYAVSYKNKYDKVTNELISKEREAFSTYYTDIG